MSVPFDAAETLLAVVAGRDGELGGVDRPVRADEVDLHLRPVRVGDQEARPVEGDRRRGPRVAATRRDRDPARVQDGAVAALTRAP